MGRRRVGKTALVQAFAQDRRTVSAIDLTLDELVAARTGESLRRPARMRWNDGLPDGMRPDGLYQVGSDLRRVAERRSARYERGGRVVPAPLLAAGRSRIGWRTSGG